MNTKKALLPILLAGICNVPVSADTSATSNSIHRDNHETLLVEGLSALTSQDYDDAFKRIETLVQSNPDYKLAQLVYADLLLAKAQPLQHPGQTLSDVDVSPLLSEARARYNHHEGHNHPDGVPKYLLRADTQQKHIVVIDLKRSRLYLYENKQGDLNLLYDFYVSIGKNGAEKWKEGDKRTPVGVYFVTSFLDPSTLPDFYGTGAFPIDYPNAWDKRLGRTGYGIWLHGNPLDSFSRPPLASDGCVTMENSDLDFLKPYIEVGETPVIIANGIDWADKQDTRSLQTELKEQLNGWRSAWNELDTDNYLAYYSEEFQSPRMNYKQWKRYKQKTNATKSFVDVELGDVSMFLYPGEDEMAVISFKQEYRSDNYKDVTEKRQYWKRNENGKWQIIYEGPA